MTDIPIIFSAPMVLALLREAHEAGTGKSMTRRLAWGDLVTEPSSKSYVRRQVGALQGWSRPSPWQRVKPGDRLWVRENLAAMGNWGVWHAASDPPASGKYLDDLDPRGRALLERYAPVEATDSAKIPSIHMPRWASRLTLVVTGTKIERLQDISEQDCEREGVKFAPGFGWNAGGKPPLNGYTTAQIGFEALWRAINGDEAWTSNPEVVAITFKVHAANIDAMKEAA